MVDWSKSVEAGVITTDSFVDGRGSEKQVFPSGVLLLSRMFRFFSRKRIKPKRGRAGSSLVAAERNLVMSRGRWLKLVFIASFLLCVGGGQLLVQVITSSFSHPFSNPLLLVGELLLSSLMIVFGIFLARKVDQEQKNANYSSRDFFAHEVFQQIRAENISSDWSVFRAGRKKVIGNSLMLSCALLFASCVVGLYTWSDHSTPWYEVVLFSLFPVSLFLGALLGPFLTWRRMKNLILVVMPEGFLLGNCLKPQDALRVKYRDIREIKVIGETVKVFGKDNWGARTVVYSTFVPRPEEASATLLAAFTRYKASYPDEITITASSTFSFQKEEQNRG